MNKTAWIVLGSVCAFILAVGVWAAGAYNGLVARQESVKSAWGQVENVLQRRFDLIPNLVNTVKGYAKHEKSVLEEVTRLRSQWGEAKSRTDKIKTAGELDGVLSRLMVVIEKYPDLKANQNFMALQDELAGTENRIAVERRSYNETLRDYNVAVRRFPTVLIAGMFGFQKNEEYFEAEKEAKKAVKVEF